MREQFTCPTCAAPRRTFTRTKDGQPILWCGGAECTHVPAPKAGTRAERERARVRDTTLAGKVPAEVKRAAVAQHGSGGAAIRAWRNDAEELAHLRTEAIARLNDAERFVYDGMSDPAERSKYLLRCLERQTARMNAALPHIDCVVSERDGLNEIQRVELSKIKDPAAHQRVAARFRERNAKHASAKK